MPAWPYGVSYTKGLLGLNERADLATTLEAGAAERAAWMDRIGQEDFATIQADPALMTRVRDAGHRIFGDNCAACHGSTAGGGPGYPNLAEAPFLWGGEPETLLETLRVGINSSHPETRISQMLAFGRDHMLERPDIDRVVLYVRSLSDPQVVASADAAELAAGGQVFAENCASCHGETATGMVETGAPDLTDPFWIYGGDAATILATLDNGRQGVMPTWESRLTEAERKLLVLYLLDLRTQDHG
jgi:cytochrome c oxidase cbb3-type subunit 3